MKIIGIGCFHGKAPTFLRKVVRKEDPSYIISAGDYAEFHLRKEFFKYSYKTEIDLIDIIGKKKVKSALDKDLQSAKAVLKYLTALNKPIISTTGNHDRSKYEDVIERKHRRDPFYKQQDENYRKLFKNIKNFSMLEYKTKKIGDYVIIAYQATTFPGYVKSKQYKKHRQRLEKLFKKHKKDKVIFLTHNPPYKSGLDKLGPKAHKVARGQYYGSKLTRRIIDKYQPLLCICAHMHENQGKKKLGKTTVVNVGYAHDKHYSVIDLKGKTVRVSFK